jgi:hypothetical protein
MPDGLLDLVSPGPQDIYLLDDTETVRRKEQAFAEWRTKYPNDLPKIIHNNPPPQESICVIV